VKALLGAFRGDVEGGGTPTIDEALNWRKR
jgi:hypothetical protein